MPAASCSIRSTDCRPSRSRIPGPARCWRTNEPAMTRPSRGLPALLPEWSVRRLIAVGATAIKILLYYDAGEGDRINTIKRAFIERVGAECVAHDVPFFLELVTYDDAIGDVHGLEYARTKPAHVTQAMAEFTKPQYGIDVLKVEVPVTMAFVQGARAFRGTAAYTRRDALRLFREAASVASKPFIYLSAGVSAEVF